MASVAMGRALKLDAHLSLEALQWEKDPPAPEWNHRLAELGGHPLQSCLWGDARRDLHHIAQHRWLARCDGLPIWMIRVEERKVFGSKIAWAPRGPAASTSSKSLSVPPALNDYLRSEGFFLLVCDPWISVSAGVGSAPDEARRARPQTIWIDLALGQDAIWKRLAKNWRYNVGLARRRSVALSVATDADEIAEFARLCTTVAARKRFAFSGSQALMNNLLRYRDDAVEARLFLARHGDVIRSGAFIIRCGSSLHYFWGATDRSAPPVGAGEAVQWAAIEWGLAKGCTRYDLEGIDSIRTSGTYFFKKKMGGVEVTLYGKRYVPFGPCGRIVAWLADRIG
jgi:hypothetical protein